MTTLHQAKEALADTLNNYASAEQHPMMFNMSVALEGIVEGLIRMQRDVDDLSRKIQRIEQSISYIQSQTR
jgi:hypothetical protein